MSRSIARRLHFVCEAIDSVVHATGRDGATTFNLTGYREMWFDAIQTGKTWAVLWHGYVRCGHCGGIRTVAGLCPACNRPIPSDRPAKIRASDGREYEIAPALMGGEGRYEDWVYLAMLEREWLRPLTDEDRFLDVAETSRPSARAVIVVVFWAYFETRIERLFREAMRDLPSRVMEDLLRRYSSVGSRMDKLYKIVFETSYSADLRGLGFEAVATLLGRVQERRNAFAHGSPQAIDDDLVQDVVACIKVEHESWIAVFNKRATRIPLIAVD